MKTLTVDLGDRSYPIHIGPNLLQQPDLITPYITGRRVMIVSNTTVAPLYLAELSNTLRDYEVDSVILPDGEQYKNLDVCNQIFTALLEQRHDRQTTLIALGGGVVGDMTGFAAAAYQRGVNFIQIPTTVLSQVDSSVGGKTGVNHLLGKNMIGAFWQPQLVLADTTVLSTLAERELKAGIAEIIKYGLLGDIGFLDWLEANMPSLLALDSNTMIYAVERSCANKARIVAADERESGKRALLNLGHTFGHAIETAMGYGVVLHGEAVAIGMCMAADMSMHLDYLTAVESERCKAIIRAAGLPVECPSDMTTETFKQNMSVDKKVQDGQLRLVLLQAIGDAILTSDFALAALDKTLAEYCQLN